MEVKGMDSVLRGWVIGHLVGETITRTPGGAATVVRGGVFGV
jgi:hypothetical protein